MGMDLDRILSSGSTLRLADSGEESGGSPWLLCFLWRLAWAPPPALFSLLNSLLFKALPVPEPERLIAMQHGVGATLDDVFTYPQFELLHAEAKGAVDLFAVSGGGNRLQSVGVDRKIETQFVSGDYFRILGIQPFLGRLLEPADDVRGSPSATAAVISYRLWQSAFQGDHSVVGRKILIDSMPFTVAGVTPRKLLRRGSRQLYGYHTAVREQAGPQSSVQNARMQGLLLVDGDGPFAAGRRLEARRKPVSTSFGKTCGARPFRRAWRNDTRPTTSRTISRSLRHQRPFLVARPLHQAVVRSAGDGGRDSPDLLLECREPPDGAGDCPPARVGGPAVDWSDGGGA